jgi:DNA-binding NarL/FixJ family response regulator/signal transduction histidine kinase
MPKFYLTPAAIGYLAQSILAAFISGYLLITLRRRPAAHTWWLGSAFTSLTLFIATLFLEVALLPTPRLTVVFVQNVFLAVFLSCMLQFAYHFPRRPAALRRESRLALGMSGLYTVWEMGYSVFRFVQLGQGVVEYRPNWSDYVLLGLLLWIPVAFFRQLYQKQMPGRGHARRMVAALRQSPDREMRALRSFTAIFVFVAALNLFNILRAAYLVSVSLANMGISLGILGALFAFASVYVNSQPEMTSFMVKLVGVALTMMLAVLGVLGWVVSPLYSAQYRPFPLEGRALHFTPNSAGGYDIGAGAAVFEPDLGVDLQLDDGRYRGCSVASPFTFPFYGARYTEVFVCNDGVIHLGREAVFRTYQYRYGTGTPMILALLVDLDPTISAGGIFVRQAADRLIITWSRLRAFRQPEAEYTFQAVLYPDGNFDLMYHDLPETLVYQPNDDPAARPWAVGAVPGAWRDGGPEQVTWGALPLSSGPAGVLHDYLLGFRQHLHVLLAPLAVLILAASAVIVGGFPLLLYVSLVSPLNALLQGVERLEAGDYTVTVPVRYTDEIGFLTRMFNTLAAELGDLIHNLEARVHARTAELDAANAQLRAEITEREQAQAQIMEQQRALATYEERERLGRELHDGLGQLLGYLNVQSQAVQTLLDKNQVVAARSNLTELIKAAQQAHGNVRAHILGLRQPEPRDFLTLVRDYVTRLGQRWGIECTLQVQETFPTVPFTPAVEAQALHILQEALVNVRKHADAECVEVVLRLVGDHIQLEVIDDGRGFVMSERESESTTSFGLAIMRERAEQVGGQLTIHARPGQGTRVSATLPRFVPAKVDADDLESIQGLRVLLADDHPLFLDGLRNLLMARGVTVVGMAHNGREAVEKTRALHPDVAVLDLHMPECDGLEATRTIKAELPEVKVVILTMSEDEQYLFEAIKNGASGYLLKNLESNAFCSLLVGVMRGEAALAPGMAERLMAEFARSAGTAPPEDPLTPRQWEVLRLVAEGLTYKEIGDRLHLSEKTIQYHMGQVLEKLHVQNRAQAIAYLKARDARRAG